MKRPGETAESRPRAATTAEESEGWFEALAEATSTAILVYCDRQRILYVNPAFEQLSDFSARELGQMEAAELVHPDFRSAFAAGQPGRQGNRRPSRLELKLVRKDGEERWVDFSADRIVFDGQPATVGTAVDITERKLAELELEESRERLGLAQRAARSLSWEWITASDELGFSRYADELMGFPVRELVRSGSDFRRYVHPEDRRRFDRALARTLEGENLAVEIRVLTPRGELRWLAERAMPIRNAEGRTEKVIGVAHDITERKIAEEALYQEKEKALVTLASIADGVIRTDAEGAIDYLNPVAQKLTGWNLAEAYGQPIDAVYRVVDRETGKPLLNPVERCLEERRNVVFPGDRHLLHRGGGACAVHDSAAPIRNRNGDLIGAVLVFKDLSQLRQVEREMLHLASHDPITGLINRREFEGLLAEALRSAHSEDRTHALCYLDLDQFKLVNDTCGHAAGDKLIEQVARVITRTVRDDDALARLGGDEFGILLPDCEPGAARELSRTVLAAIRGFRFRWQDRVFSISASGGLVPITRDSPDLGALLSAADAACYVAKEAGGNRTHFYRPGDTAIAERHGEMQWISRIHKALDDDRFCLYHQSIEPTDGHPDGPRLTELFIRLRDEEGGIVEPGNFIPAAEKFGLISAIDRWVVRSALVHLAAANGSLSDHRFALNVSGQSLGERSFLDFVLERFQRTGVAPQRVHFEITETSAIADLPNAMRFIGVLKEMGCRFVLDDFGKGLSSFSYLKTLPVDYLKIDGEFVHDLASDPIQSALVSSIHEIGRVMGLETIAEAVEDRATYEALRNIGVDYVQGYYFSRPELLER